MEFRKMSLEDVPQVLALERQCFSEPWSEEDLKKAARDSLYYYVVAAEDGKLCGYAGMLFAAEEGQITNVAVIPERRRQGIAGGMLRELIRAALGHGAESLVLEVRESNEQAISLYEKCGFVSLGIRPRFYRFPEEGARIMELRPEKP